MTRIGRFVMRILFSSRRELTKTDLALLLHRAWATRRSVIAAGWPDISTRDNARPPTSNRYALYQVERQGKFCRDSVSGRSAPLLDLVYDLKVTR